MLEILEIKKHLLAGELESALQIVEELEEIGRQSEIRNLESFLVILLIYIKSQMRSPCAAKFCRLPTTVNLL